MRRRVPRHAGTSRNGSPLFSGYLRDLPEPPAAAQQHLGTAHQEPEDRIVERTRELTAAKQFLEALLENVQDGIVACNAEGVLTLFNRATREFHGLPEQPLPAEQWAEHYDLYHSDDTTRMAKADIPLFRALGGEHVRHVEMVIAPRHGARRTLQASGQPFHDDQGALLGAVVSMHDITDRKRAEEAERRAYADLERRVEERTAALRDANRTLEREIAERERIEQALRDADRRKDEFLATLAHELRNPLAPLRNGLELLRRLDGTDPRAATARDVMDRQLGQMVRLIDDLLDLSRITEGKLELRRERIALAEVVKVAIEASTPLIESRRHQLVVDLPRDPITLDVDVTRMSQILLNLLNNAAKYTAAGGRIQLRAHADGDDVVLVVTDNGVGIPGDMLESVFEPFIQVDRSLEGASGGLGIGLALVKRLVGLHGGHIAAHSDGVGRGAQFVVRLPVVSALHRTPTLPIASADAPPVRDKLKVLVVNDNEDATQTLATMLELMGHDVRKAYDGVEAVAAAAEYGPELVLLDIGLPRLNGYDVARQIRLQPRLESLLLVALSGWGQDADKQRSREAGFDLHLVKPLELSALEELIASLPR